MEALSNWVKNLVFIILFTTLMEMFLPENNMRKYLRVVLGFFIIFIFISPLAGLFQEDFSTSYRFIPDSLISGSWASIQEKGKELEEANRELMKEYYARSLRSRIEEIIELEYPDYRKEIKVEIDDDYNLAGLNITFQEKVEREVIEIEPIQIKSPELPQAAPDFEELKIKLGQIFQLPLNKIKIYYLERGE